MTHTLSTLLILVVYWTHITYEPNIKMADQCMFRGKPTTYASSNSTLALTSYLGKILAQGRGRLSVSQKHTLIQNGAPFLRTNASHDQRHMARGRVRTTTTTSHNMAPILVNLCMQLTPLQFDLRDPSHGQMTAVKTRHPLTSITLPWAQFIEVACFFF